MPVQFLSEAEHKSLNRFPSEISSEDLNRFFLLSDKELTILKQLRAKHNRLGFALQLCCLRYLGFFPEELTFPELVISYVARQLQLMPELLIFYGKRKSTQREHQRLRWSIEDCGSYTTKPNLTAHRPKGIGDSSS